MLDIRLNDVVIKSPTELNETVSMKFLLKQQHIVINGLVITKVDHLFVYNITQFILITLTMKIKP